MKRLFIVHRWDGTPSADWYSWLANRLNSTFEVHILEMPDPANPTIEKWVSFLKEAVGVPTEETYFVGHSIGCQTILRYLETINNKVGNVYLVTPWVFLEKEAIKGVEAVAEPWLTKPITWENIVHKAGTFYAVFSDDDSVVNMEVNQNIFINKLGAETKILSQMGHITDDEGYTELPELEELIIRSV